MVPARNVLNAFAASSESHFHDIQVAAVERRNEAAFEQALRGGGRSSLPAGPPIAPPEEAVLRRQHCPRPRPRLPLPLPRRRRLHQLKRLQQLPSRMSTKSTSKCWQCICPEAPSSKR